MNNQSKGLDQILRATPMRAQEDDDAPGLPPKDVRCPLCSMLHYGEYRWVLRYSRYSNRPVHPHCLLLCMKCAGDVANITSLKHAGQPFDWGEVQAQDDPSPRYFKTPIPSKLRWVVFKRDSYRCVGCGSDEDLTVDHVRPERHGGEATLDNLQTRCRSCNSRKGLRVAA